MTRLNYGDEFISVSKKEYLKMFVECLELAELKHLVSRLLYMEEDYFNEQIADGYYTEECIELINKLRQAVGGC